MKLRLVLLAVATGSAIGVVEAGAARTFSVAEAKSAVRAQTGLRLVNFRAASTTDATPLRTKPYTTAEMWFGSMQRNGIYISFESSQRDLLLAAAKAMVALD